RHELGPGGVAENLRAPVLTPHVIDICPGPVAELVILARDRLVAANDSLGPAEIDHDIAILCALDDAAHDLAYAIFIFFELPLALGFAHLLHDDLLGVLSRNAAEIERRQGLRDKVADLSFRIALLRVLEADLSCIERDPFDNFEEPRELDLTRARVDLRPDLVLTAIARFGGLLDRVLHRRKHERAVDGFLARNSICNLQKLQAVRANSGLDHRSTPNASNPVLPFRRLRPISGLGLLPLRARRVSTRL